MKLDPRTLIVSVCTGAGYGLLMRGYAAKTQFLPVALRGFVSYAVAVMSIAFVFLVPFAMGYLAVAVKARQGSVDWRERAGLPVIAVLLCVAVTAVLLWEGFICIVMLLPVAIVFGILGGFAAAALIKPGQPATARFSIAVVALLPLVVGPLESRVPVAPQIRSVESDIMIHAPAETVWHNIERVRMIAPAELPRSWNRGIGFPRPLEATLSHEGLGGVRHATFAGGVLFIETIDEWEQNRRLGFSIHADVDRIPPTTLDEHVKVGGPYFDVLHGEYILEPRPDGTLLRLVSRHRVSTDFNWYARLWTDGVMRDVQRSILYVVRNRCEGEALRAQR